MSLEMVNESVRINRIVGEEASQTVIESDIIVPDVKPDIARIVLLDGDVIVRNVETAQDKVNVSGEILYKIMYIPDESSQSVKGINTGVNFQYVLDMDNVRQGMTCKVKCDIEHIDYEILNGRKINVKAIMKVSGKAMEEIEQEVINDLRGVDKVQVLKESINLCSYLGSNETSYAIKEMLEVPSGKPTIKEVLRYDVKIIGKEYKVTDEKVLTKGEINLSTLYIGDDEEQSLQFMEHEIPFTQFIDLPGASENCSCNVDFKISESNISAAEDNDGELRVLSADIIINMQVDGFGKRSIDVLADAYSPASRLTFDKEMLKTKEILEGNKSQVTIKDSVVIEEESPEIAQIFNVLSKPGLTGYDISDNKLVIEGVVRNSILYLANNAEQPVFCLDQELPFKHSVEIEGIRKDSDCDVNLEIEHCNYSMISANELEVRLVIGVEAKASNNQAIPIIGKIIESPVEEKRSGLEPSIVIYFSQQGDNLWKIAKRYCTTVEDLKDANDLNERDVITPGCQIMIPKRIAQE